MVHEESFSGKQQHPTGQERLSDQSLDSEEAFLAADEGKGIQTEGTAGADTLSGS